MSAWGNTDNQAGKPVVEATTWVIDATSADVVDLATDTIVVPHGFETGDALIYTSAGPITPLSSGTTYYAIRVDANTIQLAADAIDAAAGTEIVLTVLGTETDDTLQALGSDLYGVDAAEMAANRTEEGAAHVGWNKVTTIGSRKIVETLVALSKNAFSVTDAEDVIFQDLLITFGTQPVDDASVTGSAVTFSVVASTTPSGGSITYVWERSLDLGSNWVTVDGVIDGAVYTDFGTDTLAISNNTGLDTYQYRVVLSATGATTVTSSAATLTETV